MSLNDLGRTDPDESKERMTDRIRALVDRGRIVVIRTVVSAIKIQGARDHDEMSHRSGL
jgi:hypothetical protein